jgi:hypothetical protein
MRRLVRKSVRLDDERKALAEKTHLGVELARDGYSMK